QAPDTETRAPPVPRPDIPGELAFEAIDPRAAGDPAAAQRGGDLGDFLFGVVGTREREEWVAHGFRGAVFLLPPGSFSPNQRTSLLLADPAKTPRPKERHCVD